MRIYLDEQMKQLIQNKVDFVLIDGQYLTDKAAWDWVRAHTLDIGYVCGTKVKTDYVLSVVGDDLAFLPNLLLSSRDIVNELKKQKVEVVDLTSRPWKMTKDICKGFGLEGKRFGYGLADGRDILVDFANNQAGLTLMEDCETLDQVVVNDEMDVEDIYFAIIKLTKWFD